MVPLTLILTALAAGAAAGIQSTASQAIQEAYTGLKTLIQRKFTGKPEAEMALTQHEQKPDIWKAPLEEGLKETGADKDDEIIMAAQKLMALVQPQEAAMGKFNVHISGGQGFVIGDHNEPTIYIGDQQKSKDARQ
ncbi:MAG: hypothetical protein ACXVDN_21615 [Ktedonobacteraceae bacterium]